MNPTEIRRTTPAQAWNEAFPLGNGRMGVMAYGGPQDAIFDLSESTFVSGLPPSRDAGANAPAGAPAAFRHARAAALAGNFAVMESELAGFIGKKGEYGTNLPVCRLRVKLDFAGPVESPRSPEDYMRVLRLDTGVAEWECGIDGCPVRWEAFISVRHQILAIRMEAAKSFKVDISVEDILVPVTSARNGQNLAFSAQALERMHSDGQHGTSARGLACIIPGGEGFGAATRVDIFVALETDFPDGHSDPNAACEARIRDAASAGFDRILARHEAEHRELFNRVSLDLDGGEPGRAALLFQYGRYLLMSSSRPDSPLPAHLQGVWNDSVACRIGWTCDLHLDVNTQMNYWPAESARLAECSEPLFRWIRDRLAPEGRKTARDFYGLPGWAGELTANAFGRASPYWHINIAPYPTGGAWLADQMREHFLYSGDTVFLGETMMPVLRGAVEFFLGYLFELPDGSGLASGPSISPENPFVDENSPRRASLSPTCEIAVIRETLEAFTEACRILGLTDPLAAEAGNALVRLPRFRMDSGGALAEWSHDLPAADPNHRHLSHLIGLYPFRLISPNSELTAATVTAQATVTTADSAAAAAAESIRRRTSPDELWEDTGWARSALALYSGRLGDAQALEHHLSVLAGELAFPNLMIRHPPTRGAPSFADVYELDGNTGFTAAVAEGLLRSSPGRIELLPALPPSWKEGTALGLGAANGLIVDMVWEEGRLVRCLLRATLGTELEIRYGERRATLRFGPGEVIRLNRDLRREPAPRG